MRRFVLLLFFIASRLFNGYAQDPADGSVLYATVLYHYKNDGEHARSYPVRAAIIEINPGENRMILHSTARSGDQYYPFSTITTNASGKSFSYKGAGPAETGTWSIPSYADGRFAGYDGNHLFYSSGRYWVWYDLQKKPAQLVPYRKRSSITTPGNNNVFMSADGSTLLLGETSGNEKRLIVMKVALP